MTRRPFRLMTEYERSARNELTGYQVTRFILKM
jgi:hypothetical protein